MLAASSLDAAALALLIAGAVAGSVFAIIFAVRFAASFPALPPPGPETSDLGEEPPAVANLLVSRCHPTRAAVAATVIDLAARRYLELFEAGPGRFVVRLAATPRAGLTRYERQVLALVEEKAVGGSAPLEAIRLDSAGADAWYGRFAKHLEDDARARGLLRGRWSRTDWILFSSLAGVAAGVGRRRPVRRARRGPAPGVRWAAVPSRRLVLGRADRLAPGPRRHPLVALGALLLDGTRGGVALARCEAVPAR